MELHSKLYKKQQAMGVCPRCNGLIPSNEHHGQYVGAISRLTRGQNDTLSIEICSACGTEEALQEFSSGSATVVSDWPVMTEGAILRRSEAFEILLEIERMEQEDDTEEN